MASVRKNTPKTGEPTWSVLYRHGNKQTSTTLETEAAAEEFKGLINLVGIDRALKMLEGDEETGLTVDELFEKWIAWKGETKDGRPLRVDTLRTIDDYRRDYKNWIQPWFGHRAADYVDETDVQEWADHMVKNLARKSALDRHMILHSMYHWAKARSRRHVTQNPCLETEWPKKKKNPPKGTTVPEFNAILKAAIESKNNPDAADLIIFLGETGWRWSEGAALDVDSVEDDGADVWVTVTRVFRIEANRQVIAEDQAKSFAAFRRIRMFPASAAVIRRRIVGKGPADLVFLNSRDRPWNQNTFLRTTWPGITKAAGLYKGPHVSPTPHWLRHMHVAVLAAAGVPPQEIQRRIGHESIQTTFGVYGGMIGDMNDDALGKASAIMSGSTNAPTIAPVDMIVAGEILAGEVLEE